MLFWMRIHLALLKLLVLMLNALYLDVTATAIQMQIFLASPVGSRPGNFSI